MSSFSRLAVMVLLVAMFVGLCSEQALAQCNEQQKISSPATPASGFGSSISVSGDVAVMGDFREDCAAGIDCGSAYVYRLIGSSWELEQKLTASDAGDGDRFGISVSVSGDVILVGADDKDCSLGISCGAAYVFRFDGTNWVEEQMLVSSDIESRDLFGRHVSISGDMAVVAVSLDDCASSFSCGSAYVYRFNGTSWVEEQRLTASDAEPYDFFGWSVSASGNTIILGAEIEQVGNNSVKGSAYIFRFDGVAWYEQQKLSASDAEEFDVFGFDVSVDGDTAVIGAPNTNCQKGNACGSVYVFHFNGTDWVEQQILTASDIDASDRFGYSVAVLDGTVAIGAISDDCAIGLNCGSAYVFKHNGVSWFEEQKLVASDEDQSVGLGRSIFVSDDTVMVGGRETAYVFNRLLSAFDSLPVITAPAPYDLTTDRYLSFNPSTNPGQLAALRVTRVGSTTPWYVSCTLQDAGADGMLGELVAAPEFCDWTNSVIHVRGCVIVPGNEYAIETTLDDVTYSCTLPLLTTSPQIDANRHYGDLVGNFENGEWKAAEGFVTANDIVAVVQKFQLLDTAPHISRVDTDGQTPNGLIAGNDILREVLAFAGGEFGFGVTGCLSGTCVPNCP